MLGYDDYARFAPPAADKEARDAWFAEHGYAVEDLLRVGQEVVAFRMRNLADGDEVSESAILMMALTVFLFGFELGVRCERDEAPDIYGRNGDEPA